jgi:Phage T4 tail fibre
MKKILLISIVLCCFFGKANAQLGAVKGNAYEISGAGGSTIANNMMHKTWLLRNNNGDSWYTASLHDGIAVDLSFLEPQLNTRTWWERNPYTGVQMWGDMAQTFMTLAGGNLGLGTLTPTSKLEVQTSGNGWPLSLRANAFSPGDINGIKFYSGYLGEDKWAGIASVAEDLHSNKTALSFYSGQTEKMRLAWNGNVGIGTATPNEKLSVNGNIRAREIKVQATDWPDYVFEEGYNVGKLEELESYIKVNKHLPEMPSAKEIETNGLVLGELVKLQQKKIEELTLHLIEKDKELRSIAAKQKEMETLLIKLLKNK